MQKVWNAHLFTQLELGTVDMFYKTNTGTNDLKLKILI